MPKKPMVQRMLRVPEDLWERAKARADEKAARKAARPAKPVKQDA